MVTDEDLDFGHVQARMGKLREDLGALGAAAAASIQVTADAGNGALAQLQAQHQAYCSAAERVRMPSR